jgi:hypothetical protein
MTDDIHEIDDVFIMWTPWKKDFLSFPKESAKSSK